MSTSHVLMSSSYHGEIKEDGSFGSVEVRDHTANTVEELTHYVKHSPDGFGWGYEGSGPAELARCILIDVLTFLEDSAPDLTADLYYLDFKREIIAKMHRKASFEIQGIAVVAWLGLAGYQG